ncbi:MAG: class I SAM-dependent methyltransferase [Bacteroidales bacterium]|nr:class I SAM-dependent methyltransferase [Bacteroidales bacterium]
MNNLKESKQIIGYDIKGRVIDAGDTIQRIIYPEYYSYAEGIFNAYKSNNLNKIGIVDTELDVESKIFIHKKYIVSYPYEWPTEMYKEAVLFHLNLFIEADKYGLTFKDALPSNILFDYTQPVFIDFLSIIKKENILNEKWLLDGTSYNDKRFHVVKLMLIPFLINPFLAMSSRNYEKARTMLSEDACNVEKSESTLKEGRINDSQESGIAVIKYLKSLIFKKSKKSINDLLFTFRKKSDFIKYIKNIYDYINSVDVAPPLGRYNNYYEEKKENFDFSKKEDWGEKQKNVYAVLKNQKPDTVIDIGANTGWFSFLAESMGAKVIALDIEEDCVNIMYNKAKNENKNILSLLVSFEDLTREFYGSIDKSPEYADRDFKNIPLFLSPVNRFKGDIILCLGLFHHLILGMGHEIGFVFQVLSQMTNKSILMEFVNLNDSLIKSDPSFFDNIHKFNENNYNMDLIIAEGKKHFKTVELFDSHPETRKLLLFKN